MTAAEEARLRPVVHFAPRSGWSNDPHGLTHDGRRYHLFFQRNPGTAWSPACEWGHAVSDDLLRWEERAVALRPETERGEVGCWSGSVVVQDGRPTIVYTRITGDDWAASGSVALARGTASFDGWRRDPAEPVIAGAPPGTTDFRDPYVWRHGDRWHLLIGARTPDGTALALQYGSDDLLAWDYDGVVASRSGAEVEPVETGRLWECPQLFELDGSWVLLVSVWDTDPLDAVAYALGDYDGRAFTARRWGRFSSGGVLYATSAFLDVDGRRCAISWARERSAAAPGATWAGALSLPHVLRVAGDRLRVAQHPSLARLRGEALPASDGAVALGAAADVLVDVECPAGGSVRLALTDRAAGPAAAPSPVVELDVDGRAARVRLRTGGQTLASAAHDGRPRDRLRLVLDADLVEVTGGGLEGVVVGRIPAAPARQLQTSASGGARLLALRAWNLPAAPGPGSASRGAVP